MTFLVGLSFVMALLLGLWLGRARPYDQSPEEIERRLSEVDGTHRKVKRHLIFLDLLHRVSEKASDRRFRDRRRPFKWG